MRFIPSTVLLLSALCLAPSGAHAQTIAGKPFDPHMPASVPEVTGTVMVVPALYYIDIKIGTGAPALPGKQYTVNYTGWLRDGTKFDSTYDRNEPFKFVQGRRMVIAGWEVAFEGMRVGGKRRIFIPPAFAYGDRGSVPAIPPNAEMIQDIELVDVSDPPPAPTRTTQAGAPDLLLPLNDLASRAIALANAVPEDKYGWRPSPGARSFAEVLLHLVYNNQLLLNVAESEPTAEAVQKQVEENAQNEKQTLSKEKIIAMLTDSFAAAKKSLEEAQPRALGREATLFGETTTRRGVLTRLDTSIAEQYGQALAYARMNGVTLPVAVPFE